LRQVTDVFCFALLYSAFTLHFATLFLACLLAQARAAAAAAASREEKEILIHKIIHEKGAQAS